jgi:P-type Cu+ transporter
MSNRSVELSVGGMTCASCSRRVEKALTKVSGVSASVNYATGEALLDVPSTVEDSTLVAAVESVGYTASLVGKAVERYGLKEFRLRLLVATVLTIPTMAISMIPALQFRGWQWAVAALATPVASWAAYPFHRAALVNLRHRAVTMDTLVSLGVTVAYLQSLWSLLFTTAGDLGMTMRMATFSISRTMSEPALYFEVAASVPTLVLLGKYLEYRARHQSLAAIEGLAKLNPQFALVARDGQHIQTPIADVVVGDEIYVQAGTQIPVDGIVVSGMGHVDKSLVTGESLPERVVAGDAVIGATVIIDSALTVRATAVGAGSVLSGISRMVHQAQADKSKLTHLVDRVSAIFVPVVVVLAVATALGWYLIDQNLAHSLTTGIAVLVIACPCALGLATPTALLVGTGRGAQMGILIRGAHALESSSSLTAIFLDKTGTLTQGRMSVTDVMRTIPETELWTAIDALEKTSVHPIASSLRAYAKSLGIDAPAATDVHTISGHGVQGLVDGIDYQVMSAADITYSDSALAQAARMYVGRGDTVAVIYRETNAVGVIGLADSVAASSRQAINDLRAMNIKPVVISGDHTQAVKRVCDQLGIVAFHASTSPEQKLNLVSQATAAGEVVAMIGDGINDAAALAKAHLSIAMGSGTDIAASAADIVLLRSSMGAAVDAIRLSQATMRTVRLNLFWAFAYNVAAIPLAMAGYLSPVVAAGAMAASSVFVVTNSLRLRGFTSTSD